MRTERHLHRLGSDTSSYETLPHFAQSRACGDLAAILALVVFGATPEDFGGCTGAWPDLSVDVDGVGLLAPDVHFSAENEVC